MLAWQCCGQPCTGSTTILPVMQVSVCDLDGWVIKFVSVSASDAGFLFSCPRANPHIETCSGAHLVQQQIGGHGLPGEEAHGAESSGALQDVLGGEGAEGTVKRQGLIVACSSQHLQIMCAQALRQL